MTGGNPNHDDKGKFTSNATHGSAKSTNDLEKEAIKDMEGKGKEGYYGNSYHHLPNGDKIICSVTGVAGKSVTKGHLRTNFGLKKADAQYAKPISKAKVNEKLKS